ncbi:MAG TPA: TetR/AcrR family transcriptional regulator [Acidimicrobiales bacterium]
MARPPKAGGSTPERLIATAERLFAERGIEAVSLRDITNACGANSAAIHYHFGSKDQLLRAILEHRAAELAKRRDAYLLAIERSRRPTLRQVVEALVLPTAELVSEDTHGGRYYVGFLAAVLERPDTAAVIDDVFGDQMTRYLAALERVLPHVPEDVRVLRFAFAKDFINRALAYPDRGVRLWIGTHAPVAAMHITEHVVDFLVGALRAPVGRAG